MLSASAWIWSGCNRPHGPSQWIAISSADSHIRHRAVAIDPDVESACRRLGQVQRMSVPRQPLTPYFDVVAIAGNHGAPTDPAIVQHTQRLLVHAAAQKPRPRINAEHMKAVIAGRLRRQVRREMRPVLACLRADDGQQRLEKFGCVQVGSDAAAQPIGLDKPIVQRVGDTGHLREHPHVGPGPGKLRCGAAHILDRAVPQRGSQWGTAIAQRVGRVGVPSEHLDAAVLRVQLSRPPGLPHQLGGVAMHAAEVVVGGAGSLG